MPFISTSDNVWNSLLNHSYYDIYHLPSYTELIAEHIKGKALAWYKEINGKSCIIPLISRRVSFSNPIDQIPAELHDLQSPYGYPGILSEATLLPAEIDTLLKNYQQEAANAGYISSFIRLNPFGNKWNITPTNNIEQKFAGDLIVINLKGSDNAIISQNHLRNIKRLMKSGFRILTDSKEYLNDFVRSYHSLMFEKKSDDFYLFSFEYFRKLFAYSDGYSLMITVLSPQNEFAAAGIFTLYGDIMHYQYGTTNEKFKYLSPSKLFIYAAIEAGRKAGASFLNLGGGYKASNNDGLFFFKKGFNKNGNPVKFSTLQIIHQPTVYHCLPKINADFFPSYRNN